MLDLIKRALAQQLQGPTFMEPAEQPLQTQRAAPAIDDRRRTPRFNVLWSAQLQAGPEHHEALCLDISGTGAALCMEHPPQVGTRVGLSVELPDSEHLVATGQIVQLPSHQPGTVGVQFTALRRAPGGMVEQRFTSGVAVPASMEPAAEGLTVADVQAIKNEPTLEVDEDGWEKVSWAEKTHYSF